MSKQLVNSSITDRRLGRSTLISVYSHLARSKAWVCDRSPAEIVGSNPTRGMDVFLL